MMIYLATTCAAGHVEFVPAISRRAGAPYFGTSAVSCLHVIGGEFCGAEIENGQVLCDEHGALGAGVCPCFADLLEMPASDLIQATKCGIAGPHAPGAHPPPIDLDQEDGEEPSGEGAG
jgi:hypothetical protein